MKRVLILAVIVAFIGAGQSLVFSQEAAPAEGEVITPDLQAEADVQWQYIEEVVSVDLQKNEITGKYLDYETDQEKEIVITVDEKTVYENVKSLVEIKPKDVLSVDYIASPDGKNIAKVINLEKLDLPPISEEATTNVTNPAAAVSNATSSADDTQ
jgi:hypothetical protein